MTARLDRAAPRADDAPVSPVRLVVVALAVSAAACAPPWAPRNPAPHPTDPRPLPPLDWGALGLADAGCVALRDLATREVQVSSAERCTMPRRPNSTFKIVNALIGLDLGLLDGPDAIMRYDAARYPAQPWWFDGWAQDQPLREAMRISAVPLFRKLALDIGAARMADYLARLGYGNQDMSGGVDGFWLSPGGLRITAGDQLELITQLHDGKLPVSARAQEIVREVLRKDDVVGHPLYGKTGSGGLEDRDDAFGEGPMVGWLVGWVELPDRTVAFALWVEDESYDAMAARRAETIEGLVRALAGP